MQQPLQYKYEQYAEDFEPEDKNDKKKSNSPLQVDFQAQTTPPQPQLKNEEKDHYQNDFVSPVQQQHKEKTTPKRGTEVNSARQKMIEQNIKLKTQIYELAKQMDEIVQRQKKNKKYGIHAAEGQDDEAMKEKKAELKKQQIEIMNLRNKIFLTKRQLQHVYDSRGVQGKEDELKNVQKELKQLQEEKEALLRVKREQTKALKLIRNDNQYEQRVKQLKDQLARTKEECKTLSEKLIENERILRKNHELYIIKQAKIKEMQSKIKEGKEKAKKPVQPQTNVITPEMIQEIDEQIVELERERKESQKSWNQKIQTIEAQLQQKRLEQQKKLLVLKEKQKQLKLNEIRIKQLKKLIQYHTSESVPKKGEEIDMKDYRHRRNIKQIQK